ncbi:MAG: SDR family oxidoreductase, partial [Anaerolineae bacterium]|nr:SDR family oxidoreductase [Anaerolineae bacterium]
MTVKDKVAFVTGAGSGIGRAAAEMIGRDGAKVALVSRDEEELRDAEEAIRRAGGEAISLVCDVSVAEDVERAVAATVEKWGRLDLVFANAGVNGTWAPIDQITPDEWDQVMQVNLRGTYLTVHFAVPHLKKRGGSIVITSSVNGTRMFSNVGASAYATTKAGQVALAKMLALELGQDRIRVNVICPGWITTNIEESTDKSKLDEEQKLAEYPEGVVPLT